MPIPKIGPINPVNALIERIKDDESLKTEAIEEIRRDFFSFVESVFDLTPRQQAELRTKMPKEVADALAQHCITALTYNGTIDFKTIPVRDRLTAERARVRTGIDISVGEGGGIDVGVTIEWEK
jgi:hypothetical protein